jgi:hypothetical protein
VAGGEGGPDRHALRKGGGSGVGKGAATTVVAADRSHVAQGRGKQGGPISWAGTVRLAWAGLRGTMTFCNYSKKFNEIELI